MMKTGTKILMVLALMLAVVPMTHAEETFSGEVIDIACYANQGAHGDGHAGCAKSCVKSGQPMGLLTEDGTVMVLAADHKDGAPYEALKDWAGKQVEVTGMMHEAAGVKVVSVTGAKAAG